MMIEEAQTIVNTLKALDVDIEYGWVNFDSFDMKNLSYDKGGFLYSLLFDNCTVVQINQAVHYMFTNFLKGKFYANNDDFYGHQRTHIVRCLLNALLKDATPYNCIVVAEALAFIDNQYKESNG